MAIDYEYRAGGVVATPELRFTPSGAAVTNFRIAQSDSQQNDQGGWDTARSLYLPVSIWNSTRGDTPTPWAEIAATLTPGDRVVVWGKLITHEWQDKQGGNRSRIEFLAYRFYIEPTQQTGQHTPAGSSFQQSAPAPQQGATWGQSAAPGGGEGDDSEPPF